MRIYMTSKTVHAERWRELRNNGLDIVCTWIDEAGPGESSDLADLAQRCINEIRESDAVVLYTEPDEILKGALITVGAALALGVPVFCVGSCPSTATMFTNHPLWFPALTLTAALEMVAITDWFNKTPFGNHTPKNPTPTEGRS